MLEAREVEATARTLDLEVVTPDVQRAEDIAAALESLKDRVEALYVIADPLITTSRIRINTLALRVRIPTMHSLREFVEVGGLMSYGPNMLDLFGAPVSWLTSFCAGRSRLTSPSSSRQSSIS
jgi:putative ABC transport system substrate-binding protein